MKSEKAKQREWRRRYHENLASKKMKRVMITVHLDDIDRVKKYVRRLTNSRERNQ